MVVAIIAIIQNTGVITALFIEYLLYARHWRGYTPMTFWNAGVISSCFPGEETNAQNGDITARGHTVARGPSWNLNSGL